MTFEVRKASVEDLLSKPEGYYIPSFQRSFAWGQKNIVRLFEDMSELLDRFSRNSSAEAAEEDMFIGTILTVCDKQHNEIIPAFRPELPSKVWTIIDGQQRISVLTIANIVFHEFVAKALKKATQLQKSKSVEEKHKDGVNRFVSLLSMVMKSELEKMFMIDRSTGEELCRYYPKVIRSIDDAWSTIKREKHYNSPLGAFQWEYIQHIHSQHSANRFRPTEMAINKAYRTIKYSLQTKLLKNKSLNDCGNQKLIDLYESLQESIQGILLDKNLEGKELQGFIAEGLRLLIVIRLVHKNVRCVYAYSENFDEAFAIFDALNTTGEQLTAVETFKPIIIKEVSPKEYPSTPHSAHFDTIEKYLQSSSDGNPQVRQALAAEFVVHFALSEEGNKIGLQLRQQRKFLKDRYESAQRLEPEPEGEANTRQDFTRRMSYLASFMSDVWGAPKSKFILHLSDEQRVCLRFFKELNHTIIIAPLYRFYIRAKRLEGIESEKSIFDQAIGDFRSAILATAAFSILWRSAWGGTNNIEDHYRALTKVFLSVLASQKKIATVEDYKEHLRTILKREIRHGMTSDEEDSDLESFDNDEQDGSIEQDLENEEDARANENDEPRSTDKLKSHWIAKSGDVPIYAKASVVAKMLLHLAADKAMVVDAPGKCYLDPGVKGAGSTLNLERWEQNDDIEHIAPRVDREGKSAWTDTREGRKKYREIYQPADHNVHLLGNLLIVPVRMNRGDDLRERSWEEKRDIYRMLGGSTQEEQDRITLKGLTPEKARGFNVSGDNRLCKAVGKHDDDWGMEKITKRTRRLLELTWERIHDWLF